MKLKHIGVIIIFSFLFICAVNAEENISYSNTTSTVTFEEVDFIIPEGFTQHKSQENYDDLGSHGKTCYYINRYQGEIVITVISDWMGMSLNELEKDGAVKGYINNHEGWKYTENGLHCFSYVSDDKGIIVRVTNETRLNQVII